MHRRRTEVLHEDFRHYVASMGHPLPPRSPPPLTPTYLENLNEWHQQEYGVPLGMAILPAGSDIRLVGFRYEFVPTGLART
jgi:hypothetical protein